MLDILSELGSISDTSLKTPSAQGSTVPTPTRQQTFEPEQSGLRSWPVSTETPPNEASSQDTAMNDSAAFKQEHGNRAATRVEEVADDVLSSGPSARVSRPGSAQIPITSLHPPPPHASTPFSRMKPPNRVENPPYPAVENAFLHGNGPPLSHEPGNPEEMTPANHSTQSFRMGQPQSAIHQTSHTQRAPDMSTPSSNTAMLNGMYSLLSGNIHNLQLPEYQQWLHAVSQNQQHPDLRDLSGMPGSMANPASTSFAATPMQLPGFSDGPGPQVSFDGQWSNFDFGIDLNAAPDVNGAMADIWSMAPNGFEYDSKDMRWSVDG